MKYIKFFKDINIKDLPLVGGKNASLGEMFNNLKEEKIDIPNGFAVTSDGYWLFLEKNKLAEKIKNLLKNINYENTESLTKKSSEIRKLIENGDIPKDLKEEIIESYKKLSKEYNQENSSVAVRSSATAEDLPTASFAGQQETFLNVKNEKELIDSYKKCLSSLFTARAIAYRKVNHFDHLKIALSVGVQKMVNSESSGVAFTIDTESGFKDVVLINSSWGLGESIVKGEVDPDTFLVHKPTLKLEYKPILKKYLGKKLIKTVLSRKKTSSTKTTKKEQLEYSLTDNDIINLSKTCLKIEDYYSKKNGKWTPMDIEWAKDSDDKKIYIVQARPETVHSIRENNILEKYILSPQSNLKILTTGHSIGQKISSGVAKIINSVKDINKIKKGDILVTKMTDPDWVPAMKIASGIITDQGGRTCHAAIVSRELGIPAIVGTGDSTKTINNNKNITLDCSSGEIGYVYDGKIDFYKEEIKLDTEIKLPTKVYVNIADPDQAFTISQLPSDGIGLARLEFIISNVIKIHPMALIEEEKLDTKTKQKIEILTHNFKDKKDFFVDTLAQSAGTIAAAFYPRPVIIRLSDFKTNEYKNLIGGKYFEPEEENPMLGLRGASRYYNDLYKKAFELECKAMKKIYLEMGLTNIQIMIPFVRTVTEAKKILDLLKEFEVIKEDSKNPKIIMMCEIPSNVIEIDEFSKYFDGFSIGSNDLTQLTLGVDRDSKYLTSIFDERDSSVKKMLKMAIEGSHASNRPIGICGQAPSDYFEIAKFLIDLKIDSISLNPDSILPFIKKIKEK